MFVPQTLPQLFSLLIQVLILLIFVEAIVANIIAFGGRISPYHPAVRALRSIVNPVLDPFRRLLPPHKTAGWDLSPLLAILLLRIIQGYLE
ncbi:MAG: YggT family protein [Chloroherpetonaceae bacterium]|nr:YggT family protein [Chthonomonadaceae bacterium]MDW8207241.1 YggT family protein [Chloroherpetonaceae bacterium]